mmetsp:Transcript_21564/g.64214  ORF Transcript_21564/g.64214 Transcript_21564/m.64214 type:complete len:242 (+) Transcript_21564:602-1327(+)
MDPRVAVGPLAARRRTDCRGVTCSRKVEVSVAVVPWNICVRKDSGHCTVGGGRRRRFAGAEVAGAEGERDDPITTGIGPDRSLNQSIADGGPRNDVTIASRNVVVDVPVGYRIREEVLECQKLVDAGGVTAEGSGLGVGNWGAVREDPGIPWDSRLRRSHCGAPVPSCVRVADHQLPAHHGPRHIRHFPGLLQRTELRQKVQDRQWRALVNLSRVQCANRLGLEPSRSRFSDDRPFSNVLV